MTSSPSSDSSQPVRGDGALAGAVRRAAGASARRPRTMIALWLVLVIGCFVAGGLAGTKELTGAQAGVGESARADARIDAAGLRDAATENVLVRSGDAATTARAAAALQQRLRAVREVESVRGPRDAPALSTAGGRTVLVQATLRGDPDDAADHVAGVQRAVAATQASQHGVRLQQSGPGSIDDAINTMVGDDLHRAELISLPLTLIILVLAFGALVAASVPLLLGVTSVAAAMGALGVVSQVAPIDQTTGSLVVLIGLAVGVDYSLFYIRREREERAAGRGPHAALEAAAATVGRAILVSGLTVIVALSGLLVTGLSVFKASALATMLVVTISVIGSLTVLPAVLALLGDRINKGRVPFLGRRGATPVGARPRGAWAALARLVTRRPLASLVAAACLLGALAVPAFQMNTANGGNSGLPRDLPIAQANAAIERAFPGAPDSAQLVVSGRRLDTPTARTRLEALGRRALRTTGGRGRITIDVARDGRTALVGVPMPDHGAGKSGGVVHALRAEVLPTAARVGPGAQALLTGSAAGETDFTDRLAQRTPWVIAFVLGLAMVLLLAAFRSLPLALAVMGLNLLSIGATYGILVSVFQSTWAEGVLDFTSTGAVVSWLPLFAFVILFGLSMDYTVLVLERVREARRSGLPAREAAAAGVGATAGTITSAAVVMVAVFAVFATLRLLDMKQLGVGLAAAVLLDATLVRGVALPAAIAVLGDRGWKVPRRRARDRTQWDHGRPAVATVEAHHGR
ncbi:MAG TPA: MMPL family transporter [Baekduia sp.]|uniref:MMPL family transporter n=1 Tax=Baekduia sp. TaxID=2600305 RepID=UPI002C4CAF9D|nr:MMPL family transporter [Baekduia sp.]HMJ37572.1 MMPL family transporter [Baekduia sp.]